MIRLTTMFDGIYRLTQNCCQEVRTQNNYREVRVFALKISGFIIIIIYFLLLLFLTIFTFHICRIKKKDNKI